MSTLPLDHIQPGRHELLHLRVDSKPYAQDVSDYRISDVAERTGVPATTPRDYEDIGVMPAR